MAGGQDCVQQRDTSFATAGGVRGRGHEGLGKGARCRLGVRAKVVVVGNAHVRCRAWCGPRRRGDSASNNKPAYKQVQKFKRYPMVVHGHVVRP